MMHEKNVMISFIHLNPKLHNEESKNIIGM